MNDLKPGPHQEKERGWLDQQEEENWAAWNSINKHEAVRALKDELLMAPDALKDTWRRQYQEGKRIGSNDPHFHLGNGMRIRNALRNACPDDRLAFVDYGNGKRVQNWDDYYMPALREALGLELA